MRVANVLISFLLASVAACTDTTNFVGTWTYNMGSSGQVTCPGSTGTITVGGNEEFREGTDTDLVVISSDGCNLKLDANGDRADAVPGQSCTSTSGGITTTITYNSLSYMMQDKVMSFSAAGTVRQMGPSGEVTCTLSASATLHKVSN